MLHNCEARPGLDQSVHLSWQVLGVKRLRRQARRPSPPRLFQAGTFQRLQSYRSPIKSKLKQAKQMGRSVEALTADGTQILN